MIIFDNPAAVPAPAGQVAIDATAKLWAPTICSSRLITSWTTSPRSSLLKGPRSQMWRMFDPTSPTWTGFLSLAGCGRRAFDQR
jgi:hypothetical protein